MGNKRLGSVLLCLAALTALPARMPAQTGAAPAIVAAEPRLLPGDVVRLRVWREPDLSGEYPVDEFGTVVLPMLGPVAAAARSPGELRELLLGEYSRYLRNPAIELVFLRRINIMGAVREPGLYQVDPTVTVAGAIAMAGGANLEGRLDRVELIRDGQRLDTHLSAGSRIADTPLRSGDQLYVPQRGWVSRNTGLVATLISAGTTLLVALLYLTAS
jgi:protein involved in polysaccharide export with SLBB domain